MRSKSTLTEYGKCRNNAEFKRIEKELYLIEYLMMRGHSLRSAVNEINHKRLIDSEFSGGEYKALHLNTLRLWRKKYPEFFEACDTDKYKQFATERAEMRLFDLVEGAVTLEEKPVVLSTDGVTQQVQKITIKKQHKPDMSAIQFFLTNRQPDRWKFKQEIEIAQIEAMTDEELLKELEKINDSKGKK